MSWAYHNCGLGRDGEKGDGTQVFGGGASAAQGTHPWVAVKSIIVLQNCVNFENSATD